MKSMSRCFQCGAMVDASAAAASFGRCAECFARSDNSTASLSAWISAIVRASYRPPAFDDHLALWDTLIALDGSLTQTICRWDDDTHQRHVEQRNAIITNMDLATIRSALSGLDRPGLQSLRQLDDIEDAESIAITSFEYDYTARVALYSMEAYAEHDRMNDAAMAGLRSFRKLWDAIESVSPYTVRDHYTT